MRLTFIGTGAFGGPALRAILDAGHTVGVVISQPDRPAGRGRTIRPTPIHALADELGLRHLQAEDINRLPLAETFADAELGVVVDFGQKIGREILARLPRGCVNLHGSLLPKYRGAAPFQWAILNGDARTGVTTFQLDERWDAGGILGQRETPIGETETADELHDRLAGLAAELIVPTLADLAAGRAQPRPQDAAQASRAPKLSRADGVVDWREPAERIVRRIHGLWSWPAVACQFRSRTGRSERILLARARVIESDAPPADTAVPGSFCENRTIQTGRGRVRLLEVQPAGGKLMPFDAFANGRNIAPPDQLLPPEPT